ncbi:rhodanese-like domain-containing protein [Macrococcus capreoli]|uniref:rhodanese-like domain-containing protein n=1 Tax=Macrococcus capreoli TaxID=2982690 RepID=UPI0021D580F8|nr:rhodanese-like domain-containing protein [Macrococcus sp. TMW 2.2395]MCU7558323.1 rhodanese-like domain-containing protein [Macrococcus sp. TMW 2.2395]
MKNISTEEFVEKVKCGEALNIIDVREPFEVEQGMLKGALHIPMNDIPERMDELDKEQAYYIVCAHAVRSANVTQYLLGNGYKAMNVEGGMAVIAPMLSE